MRFAFTEDQELSQRSLRELLEQACPASLVRAAWSNETGTVPGLWPRLVEFGLTSLVAPESHGGLGSKDIDLVLLVEESGRAAVPDPVVECCAVGVPLLAALSSDRRAHDALERVVSGHSVVSVGLSSNPYVASANVTDALLLQHGDEVHLVPREGAALTPQDSVDRARRLFAVSFTPSAETRIAEGTAAARALSDAFCRGAVATAAQLVGLGTRLVEMTLDYAKTRQQFGKPIGSFQAVKHQLVDAHLGLAYARPLVYRAAYSMSHADPARDLHASAAKAFASDAAWKAGRVALQVHGAIGYSFEHDLHLFMKRVWSLAGAWGDAAWHRARVADRIVEGLST